MNTYNLNPIFAGIFEAYIVNQKEKEDKNSNKKIKNGHNKNNKR